MCGWLCILVTAAPVSDLLKYVVVMPDEQGFFFAHSGRKVDKKW
jgi:hypothetical protein